MIPAYQITHLTLLEHQQREARHTALANHPDWTTRAAGADARGAVHMVATLRALVRRLASGQRVTAPARSARA